MIVIGSGPAGEKAAVKAAYFGHSVALIEKEEHYGGAGVQTGTLPSKALKGPLYSSQANIIKVSLASTRSFGVRQG